MFLLGAGASVEAGVPDSYDMTKEIIKKFHDNSQHARVINFIVGGLLFQEGIRGRNPLNSGVNVEDLFNAVQLLSERHTLEAAPFVGSWHSMVEEFDKIGPSFLNLSPLNDAIFKSVSGEIINALAASPSSFESSRIDNAFERAVKKMVEAQAKGRSSSLNSSERIGQAVANYLSESVKTWSSKLKSSRPRSSSQLEREFKRAVTQSQPKSGKGRIFQWTAELMIRTLAKIVWISSPDKVNYLHPLINLVKERKRLVIATLNYDNAIELASKSNEITCNTGIDRWSKTGAFNIDEEGLHLLKLHGSIDWKWEKNVTTEMRPLPHSIIERVSPELINESGFMPAVIFGQRNKLTAEGPFLDLLRAFQYELTLVDNLTIIGYSFSDDHINTYISQWLNQSDKNCLKIIDPGFENNSNSYVRNLKELMRIRPKQVKVLKRYAGEGLKELYKN
jgi:hypothetical protein